MLDFFVVTCAGCGASVPYPMAHEVDGEYYCFNCFEEIIEED